MIVNHVFILGVWNVFVEEQLLCVDFGKYIYIKILLICYTVLH